MSTQSLAERYAEWDRDRQPSLERKREYAALTLPFLLPPNGWVDGNTLPVPWSSASAESINALASRIVSVLLPVVGSRIFELGVTAPFNGEPPTPDEVVLGMNRLTQFSTERLLNTNIRSVLYRAYQHLIVAGDVLLYVRPDGRGFHLHGVDHFVVRRDPSKFNQWTDLIVVTWEPADKNGPAPVVPSSLSGMARRGNRQMSPIFTQVTREENGTFTTVVERKGVQTITQDSYSAYLPLRWRELDNADYSFSMIEELGGDVHALDAKAKALTDLTLMVAEHRTLVDPSGLTETRDLVESSNGAVIPGREGDVGYMQFAQPTTVGAVLQVVQADETKMGRRFLQNSLVQPRGDRVTARQSVIIAEELEQQLGGVVTFSAGELMEPMIRAYLVSLAIAEALPPEIPEVLTDQEQLVSITVRSGIEVLQKEAQRERMVDALTIMQTMPDQAQAALHWDQIIRDWWGLIGLDYEGRVKTKEEMVAEAAAARQEQTAALMAQFAGKAALQGDMNGRQQS